MSLETQNPGNSLVTIRAEFVDAEKLETRLRSIYGRDDIRCYWKSGSWIVENSNELKLPELNKVSGIPIEANKALTHS